VDIGNDKMLDNSYNIIMKIILKNNKVTLFKLLFVYGPLLSHCSAMASEFDNIDQLINLAKHKSLEYNDANTNFLNSKLDVKSNQEKYRFLLDTSLTGYINDLESSSSFNTGNVNSYTFDINLSRNFESGITFSYESKLNRVDRSKWSSALLGTNSEVINQGENLITLALSLGKNFLGRENKVDNQTFLAEQSFQENNLSLKENKLLLDFIKVLIELRYQKTIGSLLEESFEKTKEQNKLIKSRFKDGLVEDIELIQSNLTKEEQLDRIKKHTLTYSKVLWELEKLIGRKVDQKLIKKYDFNTTLEQIVKPIKYTNKYIKQLKIKNKILLLKKKKNDYSFSPVISVSINYGTNKYDEDMLKALSGSYNNLNTEKTFLLNVQMPFSYKKESLNKQKISNSLALNELRLTRKKSDINYEKRNIQETKKILKESFQIINNQISKYKKLLSRKKKLYRLGKIELDSLIKTESDYLNSQNKYVTNIKEYHLNNIKLLENSGTKIDSSHIEWFAFKEKK
jgi:outer membrane protein TolC